MIAVLLAAIKEIRRDAETPPKLAALIS